MDTAHDFSGQVSPLHIPLLEQAEAKMKLKKMTITGTDAWGSPMTEEIEVPVYSRLENFVRWFRYRVLRKGRFKRISGITVTAPKK